MPYSAHAKLTLSLRITGVRDDGYHEIEALIVAVSAPCDTVDEYRVNDVEPPQLRVTGPYRNEVPADASNLAVRAAMVCNRSFTTIRLDKQIPAGAGLGGGSADAAAVLRMYGADPELAVSLGADVPFCMRGGAAWVRGTGDVIEPVEFAPCHAVIATPPYRCSTAEVYRAWDALGGPHAEPNDLEPAAHHVEPRLAGFKHAIEDAIGRPAILAGSGSSYAVLVDDAYGDDESAREALSGITALVVHATDAVAWHARLPAEPFSF